jgi:hypothetical protein
MYLSQNSRLVARRVPPAEFVCLAAGTGFRGVDVSTSGVMKEGIDAAPPLLDQTKLVPGDAGFRVEFRKDDGTFRRDLRTLAPEEGARLGLETLCAVMRKGV